MAYTQSDLDAVNKAIAAGETSIGLGDMRIQYRSIDELIKAKAVIEADLSNQTAVVRAAPRHQLANFNDD